MSKTKITFGVYYGPDRSTCGWFRSDEYLPIGTVRCIKGVLFQVIDAFRLSFPISEKESIWAPVDMRLWAEDVKRSFWSQIANDAARLDLPAPTSDDRSKDG